MTQTLDCERAPVASGCYEAHLVYTVEELKEDGCEAAALTVGTQVTSLAELVAEGEPLLL